METLRPASAGIGSGHVLPRDQFLAVAGAQAAYYVAIGVWPLVHLRSFATVTGPKPEGWLAKGVGACLANVGIALASSVRRGRVPRELRGLAVRLAVTFAAFDFYYAAVRRRIAPTYLLNGAVQMAFVAAWGVATAAKVRNKTHAPAAAHA